MGQTPASPKISMSVLRRQRPELDGAAMIRAPGARLDLLDAVIFNVLGGNADAHTKNYAIQIGAGGSRFASLCVVLCGKVYPQIKLNMAQQLGEHRIAAPVQGADWQLPHAASA